MSALGPSQSDRPFHGLWSLWDMIEFKIKPFLDAQDLLVQWSVLLHSDNRFRPTISEKHRTEFPTHLQPLMAQLQAHDFDLCRRAGERLIETLGRTDSSAQIVSAVDDMRRRLLDQAELTACLILTPKGRDLYEPAEPIFGAAFQANFASGGSFEADEAAKCLALARSTAAVFHLMRLMEIGVRAVERCLNIPDPVQPGQRNWGKVLTHIRNAIDAKWPAAATRSSGDGEFFEALYASLDAVKNPWRNSTMHPASKYTAEEAEHIYAAVRGFMMKLSSRCDENGLPLA